MLRCSVTSRFYGLLLSTLFCLTLISATASNIIITPRRSESPQHGILRREMAYPFQTSNDFKISWTVTGKRASLGASTTTITTFALAQRAAITQNLVNECVTKCRQSIPACGFAQIFQLTGSKYGTVACSLHRAYIASNLATYATGLVGSGGTIVRTYGMRRLTTPVVPTTPSSTSSRSSTFTTSSHSSTSSSIRSSTSTSHSTSSTLTTSHTTLSTIIPSSTSRPPQETSNDNSRFPLLPNGATLMQLRSCADTSLTVPILVNNLYNGSSTISSAYIVQHGSGRNFNDYFTAVYRALGQPSIAGGVIVAPNFYLDSDDPAPESFYQPKINLAWQSNTDWVQGSDAVGSSCSSYDTYDALLTYFSNTTRFPSLKKVYFVSHSGGADTISRYSQISSSVSGTPFSLRFILANPANQAYFTNARPYDLNASSSDSNSNSGGNADVKLADPSSPNDRRAINVSSSLPVLKVRVLSQARESSASMTTSSTTTRTSTTTTSSSTSTSTTKSTMASSSTSTTPSPSSTTTSCPSEYIYPYQWVSGPAMPRYVAARFTSANTLFARWLSRDVVFLTGTYDTADRFPGGTQTCGSQAQGGANRRDRNYAYWAYQNILANTGASVSAYFGYANLIATGARPITSTGGTFHHQNCIANGVGHDQTAMFASACGLAAMTQDTVPSGGSPSYP